MNDILIKELCEKFNYSFVEFLHQNFDKDTSVSKIKDNRTNQFLVLKFLGANVNNDIRTTFLNEIEFYKKGPFTFSPKMLFEGENFLIIEFFSGVTLREFIESNFFKKKIDDDSFTVILKKISNVLNQFFTTENRIFEAKNDSVFISNILFDRIGNLISSGPEYTQSSKFEQFVIRQFFKFISSKLKHNIMKIVENLISNNVMLMNDIGHYDLHSENILIGDTCKIIDFGNYKKPGIWISDILYFYATLYACFSSKNDYQKKILDSVFSYIVTMEPRLKKMNIMALVNLFCFAADSNSRFRIMNKGLRIFKLFKFIKYVYSLNN